MTGMADAGQPPLALTLGEPAGIGPDIVSLAWRAFAGRTDVAYFVIGDRSILEARAQGVPIIPISAPGEAFAVFARGVPVLHSPLDHPVTAGSPSSRYAASVIAWIDKAVEFALAGKARAVVTAPIQKETLYQAGFAHEGHTDYLAHRAMLHGYPAEPVMMLCAADLRTIPVTVHIPLKDVPARLTGDLIKRQARIAMRDLQKWFGIAKPRLGMTGLNPHAGENGTMGREEQTIIAPAIAELRAEGMAIAGPLPGDTAFHAEARAAFDVILCMYHDQALIPVKTLDFHGGVNCTLGLPFIRTSPDHGTALSLAGTGKANPRSLMAAVELAATLSTRQMAA
jgi:4-hydroxythreonine-4-phosphate dehydrogenase